MIIRSVLLFISCSVQGVCDWKINVNHFCLLKLFFILFKLFVIEESTKSYDIYHYRRSGVRWKRGVLAFWSRSERGGERKVNPSQICLSLFFSNVITQGGGSRWDSCETLEAGDQYNGQSNHESAPERHRVSCDSLTARAHLGDLRESIYRPGNLRTSSSGAVAFDFTASMRTLFNVDRIINPL